MSSVIDFNPLSVAYQQNPHEPNRFLREQSALFVEPLKAYWVGRYDDVKFVAATPAIFSNEKFHELSLGEFDYAPEATSLVEADPPEHTRLRKLALQAFKPARITAMTDKIRSVINTKLDGLLRKTDRSFDFQHEFAELVPLEIIATFMNTDLRRANDFRRWSHTLLSASQRHTMNDEQKDGIRRAIAEAREYFIKLIAERRQNPGDDLISDLILAEEDGERLTDGEVLSLSILFLNGGNDTTAHFMGNAMVTLWKNPDQFDFIRRNPDKLGDLVDEVLRYESPVQIAFLWTTQEVKVGDSTIPAESAVYANWLSANRDERRFPDADKFDITRRKLGHVAFGFGTHFCVGNMLARKTVLIELEQIFERLPELRRAEEGPVCWAPSYWVRGPKDLPVRF